MNKVVAADHPDCAGGIVWSACELRWINAKLEQQAERIKDQEDAITFHKETAAINYDAFIEAESKLATANALIEQARDALALNEVFMETPVAERKVQPFTQTHDALAAIERHLKGEES